MLIFLSYSPPKQARGSMVKIKEQNVETDASVIYVQIAYN